MVSFDQKASLSPPPINPLPSALSPSSTPRNNCEDVSKKKGTRLGSRGVSINKVCSVLLLCAHPGEARTLWVKM